MAWRQLATTAMQCADAPAWSMPDADILTALDAVHTAEQALLGAKLHLIRQVDVRRIPARDHVSSCAGWLQGRLPITRHTARRLVDAARATDRRPDLDTALSAASVNLDQTLVIDACLTDLPPEAGTEVATKAEIMLIDWAAEFDPHALHRLSTRILAHVAPEIAERTDAAALARQTTDAHAARTLALTPDGHGRIRLTGWLDTEAGAIVRAALDPCAPPAKPEPAEPPAAPRHQPPRQRAPRRPATGRWSTTAPRGSAAPTP